MPVNAIKGISVSQEPERWDERTSNIDFGFHLQLAVQLKLLVTMVSFGSLDPPPFHQFLMKEMLIQLS